MVVGKSVMMPERIVPTRRRHKSGLFPDPLRRGWRSPDFFLFDKDRKAVYRGSMEDRQRGGHHGADLVKRALTGVDATALQNTLMRMPDKVCAAGFALLPPEERPPLYALLAPAKTARIEEEIRLEARRRTSALVRARLLRMFLSYFGAARATSGTIWIKPRRTS
jgi:hypothetical protein